jgi:hypothetical protein
VTKPAVGSIGWCDLTVPGADTLRDFYTDVVGWTATELDMGGYADYVMSQPFNGTATTGVCWARGHNAGIPPVWLVYFVVASVDKACEMGLDWWTTNADFQGKPAAIAHQAELHRLFQPRQKSHAGLVQAHLDRRGLRVRPERLLAHAGLVEGDNAAAFDRVSDSGRTGRLQPYCTGCVL